MRGRRRRRRKRRRRRRRRKRKRKEEEKEEEEKKKKEKKKRVITFQTDRETLKYECCLEMEYKTQNHNSKRKLLVNEPVIIVNNSMMTGRQKNKYIAG